MSILTKVFVVLVTILSVMLVALIVPFVANTQNYRAAYEAEQSAKQLAEATARSAASEITTLQAAVTQGQEALNEEKRTLAGQITTLTSHLADSEAKIRAAQADKLAADANLQRLSAAAEQVAKIADAQKVELDARRAEGIDQGKRLIELADRNNELVGQLDTLDRQVRRFQEETVSLQDKLAVANQKLQKLGDLDPSGEVFDEKPYIPDVDIQGTVTAVQQADGDTFVQIDVGSNDGVQPNMKFMVARGGQYVGTLVVTAVDAQAAAGQMQIKTGDVTNGDQVLTGGTN